MVVITLTVLRLKPLSILIEEGIKRVVGARVLVSNTAEVNVLIVNLSCEVKAVITTTSHDEANRLYQRQHCVPNTSSVLIREHSVLHRHLDNLANLLAHRHDTCAGQIDLKLRSKITVLALP